MGTLVKSFALVIILIMCLSSIITIKPALAQVPKPKVPEFTLKFVDNSYDVPTTKTSYTDPYTGKTTTITMPGYHVQNFTIAVTIKNQPFPFTIDGNNSNLYYNIRIKGHFEEYWHEKYYYSNFYPQSGDLPTQSSTDYTVLSFPVSYSPGDQVDFQLQGILGYEYIHFPSGHPTGELIFEFQTSDWSQTQTFTMPNPTTNMQPSGNFTFIIIIVVTAISLLVIVVLLLFRRHKSTIK